MTLAEQCSATRELNGITEQCSLRKAHMFDHFYAHITPTTLMCGYRRKTTVGEGSYVVALCLFPHGHVGLHSFEEMSGAGSGEPIESPAARIQAAPEHNDRPAVWGLVMLDMQDRDETGRNKYGTPLQPFNGRDALVDAYQEALDLVVYMRQAIYERGGR